VIRAAGGVIVRGERVLLVHRAGHADWSFPKGKLERGETWEEAALREVEEETALRCGLGEELGRTSYEVAGSSKEVRYYRMSGGGEARAQAEVDEVRWVRLDEAASLLTYGPDRELLALLR